MTTYRDGFDASELERFLVAVDRHLTMTTRIVVIGGTAAALAHGASSTTVDIDTFDATTDALQAAVAKAVEETGLEIPVSHSTVAEAPYNYADRLIRLLPHLPRLEVLALDQHDLALSKVLRYIATDVQQLAEIHASTKFSFDILVSRFRDEMDHVVGDPGRVRTNFLDLVGDLFGELKRREAERALEGCWCDRP